MTPARSSASTPVRAAACDRWQTAGSATPRTPTWIVDRLEKLGLAERKDVPHDRRVKLVVLTAKGQKTRAALLNEFYRPPAEISTLDAEDLQALDRILAKLAPAQRHDP